MSEKTVPLDRSLIVAKIPKWMKVLAAQIGEITGEEIGEVLERHAGDALVRDWRERTAAFMESLPASALED